MRFALVPILAAGFLALFSLSSRAAGTLPIETQHLDREDPGYKIAILYPRTGKVTVDRQIEDWAKAQADFFALLSTRRKPNEPQYTLDMSFTVARNDSRMFELLFEADSNTGGPHPGEWLYTLNFNSDGTRVYFAEIFGIKGMKHISELTTEYFLKQL